MHSLQQRHLSKPEPLELPSISIVVPNHQGGLTIGQTLQSLLDQNYPNLEIIVIDGGSTDDSISIIRQFESHLTKWISEPDRGQSHAINKGFACCTGDIVNWLCSDDLLAPNALHTIGKIFTSDPEIDVLVGRCRIEYLTDENPGIPLKASRFWLNLLQRFMPLGTIVQEPDNDHVFIRSTTLEQINLMPASVPIHQPSCFYRRRLLNREHPVNEDYHYTMDIELFNYFYASGVRWQTTDAVLSIAPVSGQNKSSLAGIKATYELEKIYATYVQERIPLTYWHRHLRYPLERFLKQNQNTLWIYLIGPLWVAITLLLAPFYGFKRAWALRWTSWI
ncbi:MAG: glycosyltransferase [Timaviella obliquedivisa GSE-PSE-MK23-08B]|jgi:glycosyltransferase involved in cell wall biosynthesis|nr:glycosyltransferase [Timaviella obliquedivisa GSE-PSE-MK23-08B]